VAAKECPDSGLNSLDGRPFCQKNDECLCTYFEPCQLPRCVSNVLRVGQECQGDQCTDKPPFNCDNYDYDLCISGICESSSGINGGGACKKIGKTCEDLSKESTCVDELFGEAGLCFVGSVDDCLKRGALFPECAVAAALVCVIDQTDDFGDCVDIYKQCLSGCGRL